MPIKADIFKRKTADTLKLSGKSQEYLEKKLNAHLKQEIMKSLGAPGEKIEAAVSALKLHYKDVKDLDLKTLIQEKVLPALGETPSLKKELADIATQDLAPYPSTKIGDLLHLDKPFRDNPVFAEDARRVKVMELASIVKLDSDASTRLADKLDLGQAGDPEWESLVSEGAISGEQARKLRLAAELADLTDDNFKLVKALKTDQLTSLKDFAALDQREWLKLLKNHSAEAPAGETLEEYAGNMAANLERAYPTDCFFQRIALRDRSTEVGLTGVIKPLLTKNRRLFGSLATGEINWEGVPGKSQKAIRESLTKLGALANTYRHLGVADILNNPALKAEEKQKKITEEIARLEIFYRDNPDLDLGLADFFETKPTLAGPATAGPAFTKPVWEGIAPDDRPRVRKQLMAYQRVMSIAGGSDNSQALLAKGFDSSYAITSLTEDQFTVAAGLPPQTAAGIYASAGQEMVQVGHSSQALHDVVLDNFKDIYVGNTDPTLVNQLKEIDGYEDLFGSQNYCHCSHCKSIFGPAAYLVDLMYFIEKNISNNVFSTKLDHPLYLKNRRPDLWKLSLTCNNTNTPIPYLEMVNEVLEQYLETVTPRGNIYKKLSAAKNSIKLPFHKPLEELRLYLGHFELALPEILELFKVEPLHVAREQLCLSQEELHAIVTPDYKGAVIRFGSPPSTTQMKVRDFLKYSGLTRDELDMLVSLKFIKGSGNLNIELEEKADDIQRFDEKVVNLNRSVLDRIQRFIRLWRQVPWSMTELDLVLDSLSEANLAKDLKQEAVICIAGLSDIQKRLKMSVEELCALFYLIPNNPVKAGEPSLYERLFEQDELLGKGSYFNFYHAFFNKNNPDDKTVSKYTPGLLSGLGITQGELLLLLQFLRNELQISDDGKFTINRSKLSLLYRHARLAKALKISLEDLLKVIELVLGPGAGAGTYISKPEQIEGLIAFLDWLKGTPFSIAELSQGIAWPTLIDKLKLSPEDLQFIEGHPDIFKHSNTQQITLRALKLITFYKKLNNLEENKEPAVHQLLTSYEAKGSFSENDLALLAKILEKEESILQSLPGSLTLPQNPLEALELLMGALRICSVLGINGTSLNQLTKTSYDDLQAGRDMVYGAFKSKYDEVEAWEKVIGPYDNQLNTKKRNALCDYILAREKQLYFKDRNDLYSFFLLDVEMSGCARASRVGAAISSLQLYVHRCLVNLEQSQDKAVTVLPSMVPPREWEWRKNYRVWEANRKVFLYPENYIEPELRDNKSPLFRELEDELLQQKITRESAENAYKKYITQFAEVARLKIAGSYYHQNTDTLYLFGITPFAPPQYYFRKYVARYGEWSPWEKIELSINAYNVSALIQRGRLYLFWVDINTQKNTEVVNGNQVFKNYENKIYLQYSYMNESGKWIPPQKLEYKSFTAHDYNTEQKVFETGPNSKKFYPVLSQDGIVIGYRWYWHSNYTYTLNRKLDLYNNKMAYGDDPIDFAYRKIVKLYKSGGNAALGLYYSAFLSNGPNLDSSLITDKTDNLTFLTDMFNPNDYEPAITIVQNKVGDLIVQLGSQQYLIRCTQDYFSQREFIRISTSLADSLGEILFEDGLEALLSLTTQQMKEASPGITFTENSLLKLTGETEDNLPFKGPYGIYFKELFFHIPALIANHLNANQKFKEAKEWYEKIFDPTASENPEPTRPADRNWRYLEFRKLGLTKLKEILSDQATIEQYKKDPFAPHAIARLRLSAYQKAMVMKYIDNLLDWGDNLFARDTVESINEASMLYSLAADILGQRPVQLGKCKSPSEARMTYAEIGPVIKEGSEFIITLENWKSSVQARSNDKKTNQSGLKTTKSVARVAPYQEVAGPKENVQGMGELVSGNNGKKPPSDIGVVLMRQGGQVFCVPPNDTLLGYWDRVADRLFKIRNCMNIKGVRRQLALFDPPINPAALVKAKAAGLSLEDFLASMNSALPPYRFVYLIEKAKGLAATVQGFGSALLGALEKKDVEELTQLRSVHEQNILKLTKEIKKKNINEAKAQLENLLAAKVNIENRKSHYEGLIETGLIKWETTEQVARHTGTALRAVEGGMHLLSGISYLIPQLGSPFAMKYGGQELGSSTNAFAEWLRSMASVAEAISSSAALEAGFQRREQEWNLQQKMAAQELSQMEQQIIAAGLRIEIAEKDLEIHETGMEQTREVYDLYKNKFTNLGLYNYLSTSLCRLYREAYNLAHDLAKMAERTYQFERDDDTIFIENDNWQADRAGLLAGERLLLQLNRMEKSFLEVNYRDYEITQSFSMQQINPSALLQLKETGACDFTIPELFFDLFYPGQYKRVMKSTQLTIPCVTGPYTNVSCKLSLTGSQIRKEPKLGVQYLLNAPQQRSASVATSSANNDGGLFELNFSDERYMPFEGAGAVSTWRLELPGVFRPFNYETISDVIFHISYTAKDDGLFKQNLETVMQQEMMDYAANYGLFRLFSLRHEFPTQWHQLLNPAGAEQKTTVSLDKAHFPYLLSGKNLDMTEVRVILQHEEGSVIDTGSLTLKINEFTAANWATAPGELKQAVVQDLKGTPLGDWAIHAGVKGLDKKAVKNIFLLLKYTIL